MTKPQINKKAKTKVANSLHALSVKSKKARFHPNSTIKIKTFPIKRALITFSLPLLSRMRTNSALQTKNPKRKIKQMKVTILQESFLSLRKKKTKKRMMIMNLLPPSSSHLPNPEKTRTTKRIKRKRRIKIRSPRPTKRKSAPNRKRRTKKRRRTRIKIRRRRKRQSLLMTNQRLSQRLENWMTRKRKRANNDQNRRNLYSLREALASSLPLTHLTSKRKLHPRRLVICLRDRQDQTSPRSQPSRNVLASQRPKRRKSE